ncbi:MAG: peptidoglycan-binding domain-containing protein, partial [Bacillota bacterium]
MCLPFAASAHTVLKHGMRGESVRELQDILNILGFLDEGSDGVFGDRTRQAVIAFQKANGLTVDGIVGADTWSLL